MPSLSTIVQHDEQTKSTLKKSKLIAKQSPNRFFSFFFLEKRIVLSGKRPYASFTPSTLFISCELTYILTRVIRIMLENETRVTRVECTRRTTLHVRA